MPFAPKLSSPPTSEELKAYHEWLNRPVEMKSVSPPVPEPPLPEGVASFEQLLELADREDPSAQLGEGNSTHVPADHATEPTQVGGRVERPRGCSDADAVHYV